MIAHCRLPRTLPCGRPADRALSPSLTAACQHPGQLPRLALWQERGCAPRATRENDHLSALGKLSDSHARFAAENQAKSWIPVLKSDRTSERVYEVPCNPLYSLRENAIAKEPGSSYFRPRRCVSRLGLANGGLDSLESSPYVTLSRGGFSASSLVTPIR